MAVPEWQYPAYERLRTEIVRAAVEDYKAALRRSKSTGEKCSKEQALEKFFLSAWGQTLTGNNGEYIIELCRKDCRYTKSPMSRQKLSVEKQRELIADYLNGAKGADMAKKYGVSIETVYRCIRRWA
jgi:hypothetical protein